MIRIGIVVPFYNGYQYLEKLLYSISSSDSSLNLKVFIIDNSSEKKTLVIPTDLKIPVEIIIEKAGIGYGKACNKGYELCCREDMDYMIIANQDGYFSPNLILSLISPFNVEADIQVAAPLILNYDGEGIEEFFIQFYLSQVPGLVSDLLDKELKSFYEIQNISGACFAFNLGNKKYRYGYLFDPLFHMYYEDEDLCRRIHMIDCKIVIIPQDAIFYHLHSRTMDKENQQEIKSNRFDSEKILSLKDPSKSVPRILYSIFVNVTHLLVYFILKGNFKKFFYQVRSVFVMFFHLPAIIRARKRDILISKTILQEVGKKIYGSKNHTVLTPNPD